MSEKKMIIDGIECPFTDERNVLEVARHNGIDIPSLCYCENLSIYGGCRLCLVENDRGALDAACSMQPRNGLVVYTHSKKVLESRRTTLQLLMSSHRADCLTCEQSGSCKLQEYAHRYNVEEPRFQENTYNRERLDVSSPCITRDPSKCILCGLCVRMCAEVQNIGAIDFTKRGKKAMVAPGFGKMLIETGCVGCGQCAAVCPTGALTINRQIPEMWKMLNDPDKRVVVQFAPSVRVGLAEQFGMPANEPVTGKLVTALRRLGFDVIYDTNLTADLTIMEESAEFLEKVKNGAKLPMFTSCCPGWIQHVEKAHPNLMPQVSTCGSPMEMFGALIRQQFKDEDVYSVAIMPCTAKKFEAQRPELEKDGKRLIDLVLTTDELGRLIKAAGIDFANLPDSEPDDPLGDVVIIGGGVVGCALARELSQFKNLKVVVLETFAEVGFGTSKANSGIVHPGHHDKPGTVKASLVVRGNQLIDELAKELGFGYRRCGEVMVAKTEAEFDELKELMKQAAEQKVPVELWDRETLRAKEPHLSKDLVGGVYAPTAGVVSPYEMVHSLAAVAARNGVEFLFEQQVTAIDKLENAADGARLLVKTGKGLEVRAKYVVNAAGIFSDKVAEMVGLHDFVIKPRKGEEYLLDKNMSYITKRVILPVPTKVSKGILIIPTVDETIMCGPTAVETEDRYDLTCTPEGCKTIFSFVSKMCNEINDRQVIASFAGLRAAANTGDFIIGPTAVKGFINAAGIQSPGLTSAPAIAERLVEILGKEGLVCEPRPAGEWKRTVPAPRRLFSMSEEEQDKKVKENPAYGRVVCRCELVTEGDIEEAIEYGARTLDGVKFRTRAGMGRCQGGFCTSRIVQMLAEHQKVTLDKISKRGTGSEILDDQCLNRKPSEQPDCLVPNPVHLPDETHVVDVAIIGGGPAGLAAGVGARESGANDVLVFDREDAAGGILNQCIHSGFGLHYFQEELTGPEYAQRFLMKALEAGVKICTSSYVMDVTPLPTGDKKLRVLIGGQGVKNIIARSVVIATGCRERPRAAIKIPGSRPAGVFTAGLAQKFVNVYGHLPGKNIVILGSGDIGLIMARRMTLEHCNVLGVFEILPTCNGLKRNVVQCLEDYKIPLHLSHTVVAIHGKDHVEGVTVAPCDPKTLAPDMSKAYDIKCDCLLLSVGLIPENEVSRHMGVKLHPRTNGPIVDSSLETNVPGVFACGNALQVHDLVDNVSAEGLAAGRSAARHALHHDGINLSAGEGIGYILPASLNAEQNQTISFRVRARVAPAVVHVGSMYTAHLPFAIPSEMVRIEIPKTAIQKYLQEQLHGDNFPADGSLNVKVDVVVDKEAEEKERKEKEAAAASPAAGAGHTIVELTCICCPHGCSLKVEKDGDKVIGVTGNSCGRGAAFGEQEVIDPRRVFSTTVPIEGAICGKIPVKLTQQFPKTRLIEAAYEIQKLRLKAPVKVGQVLIKDLLGEKGCNVVACRTLDVAAKESEKYTLGAEYVKRLEAEADASKAAAAAAAPKKEEGAKSTLRLLPMFASNHANGNSAKQLEQFIAGAEEAAKAKGVKLEVAATINLNRKKISPCTYCGACQKKPVPGCVFNSKDDMGAIMEEVLNSDIIVHAVPVWFWSAPSQFKSYLDRYTQLFTREWQLRDEVKERTNGLTFAGIVTCGNPDHEKTTAGVVQSLSSLASFVPGWRWAGASTSSAKANEGPSEEALKKAFDLGKAAVEKALA